MKALRFSILLLSIAVSSAVDAATPPSPRSKEEISAEFSKAYEKLKAESQKEVNRLSREIADLRNANIEKASQMSKEAREKGLEAVAEGLKSLPDSVRASRDPKAFADTLEKIAGIADAIDDLNSAMAAETDAAVDGDPRIKELEKAKEDAQKGVDLANDVLALEKAAQKRQQALKTQSQTISQQSNAFLEAAKAAGARREAKKQADRERAAAEAKAGAASPSGSSGRSERDGPAGDPGARADDRREARERADRDRADRERADRDRADRERADRDRARDSQGPVDIGPPP